METKAEIRNCIKNKKKKMTLAEIEKYSYKIIEVFTGLQEFKDTPCILTYVNFNEEVVTKNLIREALALGKRVAVPKIVDNRMDFYYIHSFQDLKLSDYGILEPYKLIEAKESSALMVMPGLAFDLKGHRIGYGKGYYDGYIKNHLDYHRIVLAYRFQVFEEIPFGDSDISVHQIVTEKEMITINLQ